MYVCEAMCFISGRSHRMNFARGGVAGTAASVSMVLLVGCQRK